MLILTPPEVKFSIRKVFKDKLSSIVAVLLERLFTNKSAVYELAPAETVAVPTILPILNEARSKDPPSVVNNAEAISISPASWLTSKVTSVNKPQSVFESIKLTDGEKSAQLINWINDWLSTWLSSEVIVDEKVNNETVGFKNKLWKVTFEVYPPVVLLPSPPGLAAVISIPLVSFLSVNDPRVPVESRDKIIVLNDEVDPTTKIVLTLLPDRKFISAVPIVSPMFKFERSKEPASVVKTEFKISVSPASWLTSILKSDNWPQIEFDKLTFTVGDSVWE